MHTHDTVLAECSKSPALCHRAVVETYDATVDALRMRIFPFLNSDETNNGLISELPTYVAVVQDVIMNSFSRHSLDIISSSLSENCSLLGKDNVR